jgi:DNA primase
MQDTDTTKYIIHSKIKADGIVERPDVVGAIFGQTEGLLGNDLDLRELQKTGRIGRIEVNIKSTGGKSNGTIDIPSSLDKTETAVLAASLETIDRIGPCIANIDITKIEDIRASKRHHIVSRAKHILTEMFDENIPESQEITDEVKQAVRVKEMVFLGKDDIPCGPNVADSDAIIVVEGRADVLNLLRYGIKNSVAVGGTNVPKAVIDICKNKKVTAFTDGDRGGELIIKELLQVAEIDFIARAPDGKGVEELVQREIIKSLRQKIPVEQAMDMYQIGGRKARTSSHPKRREERRDIRPRIVKPAVKSRVVERQRRRPVKSQSTIPGEFKEQMSELSGTLSGRFLDENRAVIKEVMVRDLANSMKDVSSKVKCVIFDGVVTQRLVDIAAEKNVREIIGAKIGNVTKVPVDMKISSTNEL